MANMTLAIPDELHAVMRKHSDIKWSEVARRAIAEQARKLEYMDKILGNSTLTKKDIDILDHKIKASVRKKFEEKKLAAPHEINH